jgi:TolB-like protein
MVGWLMVSRLQESPDMRRASLALLLVVLSAGACMSSGSGRSIARRALTADARRAIQEERTIGAVAGPPTTVAVLPMRFSGSDSSLRPLERGFSELLATDLSRSSKLTVVERARIQALLDELALQRSGRTDSATNVRAGRLLRAGRIVQGSILQVGASHLRVDAAVLDVPTAEVRGAARGEDGLDRLFDLEKRIAFGLFDELGVTLTVAERNAIEQRPTRSLAAFLAYSRGLTAEDDGRFDDANRFYRDAVRIDPGFGAAVRRSRDALFISDARQARGNDVADAAHATADDLNPSSAGAATAPGRSGEHGTPQKDAASAATDTDKPGNAGRSGKSGNSGTSGRGKIVVKGPKPK